MIPLLMLLMSSTNTIDFAALRWEARLIVLQAATADDDAMTTQRARLDNARDALRERDVRIIRIVADQAWIDDQPLDGAVAQVARERFRIAPDAFAVLLIGKDGGVKLRESEPVEARRIIDLIDSMPMRQQEIRERPASRGSN
jgi:hypothetical protein